MEFEWDEEKAQSNIKKHGVSFERAVAVFNDSLSYTYSDPYKWEDRFRTVGFVDNEVYCVVFTYRGDTTRIISARKATRDEKRKHRLF